MRLRIWIPMWRKLALLVFTGLLFLPREAHLSQVHHRAVSLEDLISRSELVLVVKAATPAQRQIPISIGKDAKGKAAPDFVRVKIRCEVQAALTKAGADLVGKTIEIDGANWSQRLSMHKSYYLQGISKSPIWDSYRPSDPAPDSDSKDAPYIVFLRRQDKGSYAFVVLGATERIAKREAIETALRDKK